MAKKKKFLKKATEDLVGKKDEKAAGKKATSAKSMRNKMYGGKE